MKIGIVSINVGGPSTAENMVEVVQHAEAAGIESVWTFEHVMVPTDYDSKYPYAASGKITTTKTLQRVVNAADGWYAPSDSQQELKEKIAELKEMAAQAGRPFESIDITTNWRTAKYPDALPQLEELGITRAVALLGATGESDPRKAIDLIASRAGL